MANFCYVNWNWMFINGIGIEKNWLERYWIGIEKTVLKEIELELNKRNCNELEQELELIEWNWLQSCYQVVSHHNYHSTRLNLCLYLHMCEADVECVYEYIKSLLKSVINHTVSQWDIKIIVSTDPV